MVSEHDDGMSDAVRGILTAPKLSSYRDRDVIRTSIAIRKAGDGLSEAMGIDPIELTIGDHVFVVLECVVAHHDYGPIKDTDCLELKQVLNAEGATLVDEELVRKHLDEQSDRVREAKERAAGIQRLSLEDEPEEADAAEVLIAQHRQGVHEDGLRDGCTLCNDERVAMVEEAAEAAEEPTPIGKPRGRTRKAAE